ncbi:EsaB/YukD family protein [Microbacterium sp. NEAU-LLC]|uniref:EsaB/YukD family protein n=1 Tax=Microbacterium helvum TaxID=2773713 RepID=A0ABR8NP40_9MICO|nr:EsaB/YukD family protein [Microbacterium helvum]MBD3942212.1 EsaB/YukD family protein [Microbacterium helvum]
MTDFTRLSVTGTSRRTDIVVPSDEPVGTILPSLLRLLGEPTGTVDRPLALVHADGEPVDLARSARGSDLLDGTSLRLVRLDAAPPPPVVIDVTDAAAEAYAARADRWSADARLATGAVGLGLATALGGLLLPRTAPGGALWWLVGALVLLLALAVPIGRRSARPLSRAGTAPEAVGVPRRLALCATAAAAGLVVPIGVDAAALAAEPLPGTAVLLGVSAAALGAALVVLAAGWALRRAGAVAGGVIGVVLWGLLLVLLWTGVGSVAAAAIAGTVAAFATGLLPWAALSSAQLTVLDQRVSDGDRVDRATAAGSIDEAYRALTWSVAAVATLLAAAGIVLVATRQPWPSLLALAFALTAALRTRSFPLRVQVRLLWAAVAAPAAVAMVVWFAGQATGVWICAGAAVLLGVAALVDPRPAARARLRGIGNVLETLAAVSLLPLLLGALGVYDELLGMFS